MRISDWSSDVCSSDLRREQAGRESGAGIHHSAARKDVRPFSAGAFPYVRGGGPHRFAGASVRIGSYAQYGRREFPLCAGLGNLRGDDVQRSEEHTSELQSLMRISYAVICLKQKTNTNN